MGIFLGLVAAISLGIADFLARFSTKLVGTYRTLLYMQLLGLIGLSLYGGVSQLLLKQAGMASWETWTWTGVVILLNVLSSLAFYRSLQVGTVSIVSPIAAGYAAVIVLLSVLTGSSFSLQHTLGIGAALLGVVGASITFPRASDHSPVALDEQRRGRWSRGVGLAMSAAVGYGGAFWLLGAQVSPQLGPLLPIWLIRLVTPCLLATGARIFRQSLRLPHGRAWWFIGGVGLFDTVGYVSSAAGLAIGPLAIVGVLISLFSAVTVLLAWVFLRERLQWSQWLGVSLIFVGIVLVNS